jgi:hypothetical protein
MMATEKMLRALPSMSGGGNVESTGSNKAKQTKVPVFAVAIFTSTARDNKLVIDDEDGV